MSQYKLVGNDVRMVLEDNLIAVVSGSDLTTVSSAIYNGGFKKVKAILNVQVPEGYSDRLLHENSQEFIANSSKKTCSQIILLESSPLPKSKTFLSSQK